LCVFLHLAPGDLAELLVGATFRLPSAITAWSKVLPVTPLAENWVKKKDERPVYPSGFGTPYGLPGEKHYATPGDPPPRYRCTL
jgi:hypothetical protein